MRVYFIIFWPCLLWSKSPTLSEVYNNIESYLAKKSPGIQTANSQHKKKLSENYSILTEFFPNVDLSISKEYNPDAKVLFVKEQAKADLSIRFPLYRRSLQLRYQNIGLEVESSHISTNIEIEETFLKSRELFGSYILQYLRGKLLKKTYDSARKTSRDIEKGRRIGKNTSLDVLRAQARVENLKIRQHFEEQTLNEIYQEFTVFIGMPKIEFQKLNLKKVLDSIKLQDSIDGFTENKRLFAEFKAIENRSDKTYIKKFELESKIEKLKADQITQSHWPEVSFQSTLSSETEKFTKLSGNSSSHEVRFGVFVKIPLFSFGKFFSQSNEQSKLKNIANIKYQQKKDNHKKGIDSQKSKIDNLKRALDLQKKLVKKNSKIVYLAKESYKLQKANFSELELSENDFLDSQINLIQYKIDLSNALRRYSLSMGKEDHVK